MIKHLPFALELFIFFVIVIGAFLVYLFTYAEVCTDRQDEAENEINNKN